MFNLTKGELYKILRSKVTRVLSVIVCLYSFADIAVMIYCKDNTERALGLTGYEDVNGITAILSSTAGELFYIIMGILTAIIVCAEFSTGSIRQIISRGFVRDKVVLAKYVALCLVNAIFIYGYVLLDFLGGVIIGGIGASPEGFSERIPFMAIGWIFMIIGYVAVAMFLSFVFKSGGIAVAVNILLIMFGGIIVQLLAMITKEGAFIKYWFTYMSTSYNILTTPIMDYVKYFIVFTILAVGFVIATVELFKKRDIA